jgi:hypothetical protein
MPDPEERPCGYQDLTVPSTNAVTLDTALILQSKADGALISFENGEVRLKFFGTATATSGHLVDPPTSNQAQPPSYRVRGHSRLLNLSVIAVSGIATLRISYFTTHG